MYAAVALNSITSRSADRHQRFFEGSAGGRAWQATGEPGPGDDSGAATTLDGGRAR